MAERVALSQWLRVMWLKRGTVETPTLLPHSLGTTSLTPSFFDETFESEGQPRAHYRLLIDEMERMSPEEVERLQERVTRSFLDEGHHLHRVRRRGVHRAGYPHRLRPPPRARPGVERHIERGLIQRVQALNLFLADVYGKGHIISDTVPSRATLCMAVRITAPRWKGSGCRSEPTCQCVGVTSCGPRTASWCWRTTSGCPQGCRICSPAGRRSGAPSRCVFRRYHVRSVDHYGQELLRVLRSLSPRKGEDPSIALLTPRRV